MSAPVKKNEENNEVFLPPHEIAVNAHIDAKKYEKLYAKSVKDPEGFWGEMAERLDWFVKPKTVKNTSFDAKDLYIRWFEDGVLNVSYNCIDRHLPERAKQTALIWEGDNPS